MHATARKPEQAKELQDIKTEQLSIAALDTSDPDAIRHWAAQLQGKTKFDVSHSFGPCEWQYSVVIESFRSFLHSLTIQASSVIVSRVRAPYSTSSMLLESQTLHGLISPLLMLRGCWIASRPMQSALYSSYNNSWRMGFWGKAALSPT